MASDGNLFQCSADEAANTRQENNQSHENETRSSTDSANSKHKNPFGSLLSLAWKLCEAEQKKCKLSSKGSTVSAGGGSFSMASIFRTQQNVPTSYDRSPYVPFEFPRNNAGSALNYRSSAMLPTPVTAKMYGNFENSVLHNVTHYADDFNIHKSYSPEVPRINNLVASTSAQKEAMTTAANVGSFPQWGGDNTAFENDDIMVDDSDQDEELHLSERRRHQCHMCKYQTDNRSHMLRHQATAHDACKLYHCYICKMDFSRSERAKSHFLSIHPEIPYHSKIIRKRPYVAAGRAAVTPIVDPRLSGRELEITRMQQATSLTGAAPGTAPVLGRKSWEKYCRLIPPSGLTGCHFRCVRCPHVGPDIWHLKRHFLGTHSGTQAYSCRVCRYSTGDVQRLIGHMTGHGELFCYRCSFSTVELERFKEHLTTCTGEGNADSSGNSQCPVCGDHFEDNRVVKQHVSEMHQRDYCEYCACVIYGPETIEDHLLQHQSENTTAANDAASADGHMQNPEGENQTMPLGAVPGAQPDISEMSKEALETTEEGVHQSKYRFGRFSNQTYYCPVVGCPFKATWKKSIDLHSLNYHTDMSVDDHADAVAVIQSSSPDVASATAPVAISGLFNCPFCPNCRTFKYRKSYEKHLLQHGVDYVKHPYLVVRSSQRDDSMPQNSAVSVL